MEDALPDPSKCKSSDHGAEDAEFGRCAAAVGIVAGDSRDRFVRSIVKKKESSGPSPDVALQSELPHSGRRQQDDAQLVLEVHALSLQTSECLPPECVQGQECCSDYMVSFHYVNKANMYSLDYLLYHVRPFALGVRDPMPEGKNAAELLEYAKKMAEYNKAPEDAEEEPAEEEKPKEEPELEPQTKPVEEPAKTDKRK